MWSSITPPNSQALHSQSLASKRTSFLPYTEPFFKVTVETLEEGGKNNIVISKKTMLQIDLRSSFPLNRSLDTSITIISPPQRKFKKKAHTKTLSFLSVSIITDLIGREKLPANGFVTCHSCSPQEKRACSFFQYKVLKRAGLKILRVNFPLQYLAAQL